MMGERHSDWEKLREIRLAIGEYQEIHEDNLNTLLNFITTNENT